MKFLLVTFTFLLACSTIQAQKLPIVSPLEVGMDSGHLSRVDDLVEQAIQDEDTPGAVLIVVRDGKIAYRKAYGNKQIYPEEKVMEANTVFDMASITKPVATATSLMILLDRGLITLNDPISRFIPGFMAWGDEEMHQDARIVHLLTHSAGLPSYAPVSMLTRRFGNPSPDSLHNYFSTVSRNSEPGTHFSYSCPSFITLQRIIEAVTGQSLDTFTQNNIFLPLGMYNTTFKPGENMVASIAPTQVTEDGILIGDVHDPLANRIMNGISGNAGLFSSADDMAIFATMMLNEGVYNGKRILSPAAVKKMIGMPEKFKEFGRGLGWDLNSSFSSNQGDLFGKNTYGHTGYTGTSITLDPDTNTAVILLTNRVHPHDTGSVVRLRSLIANVVAASIIDYNGAER
ncbi:MAG: serine hydrolase [Balneolales bacterium]